MNTLPKQEVKELLKSNLIDFCGEYGFTYKPNIDGIPGFLRITDYGFNLIGFSIISTGGTNLRMLNIRHDKVEKIILEVGLADRVSIGKYECTCSDTFTKFLPDEKKEGFFLDREVVRYTEAVKGYMIESGLPFAEKFSKLDNILEKINELEAEGKSSLRFVGHGPDFMYRELIISKLCSDPGYYKKLEKISNIILGSERLTGWVEGLEKLKKILETY